MSRRAPAWLPIIALLSLLMSRAGAPPVAAQTAVVEFHFFYSNDCEYCQRIKSELLPSLVATYGAQIKVNYLEISDPAVFRQMVAMEQQFSVSADKATIPEIYIGGHALIGADQIEAELPVLVEQYLAQGGVALPELVAVASPTVAPAQPVVRFYLFYSQTCAHCHEIMENYLPGVYQKYGSQLEHQDFDLYTDSQAYLNMLALEKKLGVPEGQQGMVPTLIVGDKVLIGASDIPARLESIIDGYLAQGGVDYPSLADLPPPATPTPQVSARAKPIYLAYFYKAGCTECDRAAIELNYIEQTYPQVQVAKYSIEQNQALAEWLGERLGVPAADRLAAPAVFVGTDHLLGDRLSLHDLQATIDKYVGTGAEATWVQFSQQAQDQAKQSLIERYRSLGVLTVLGAGLVNGLNPCAFVTIVFFLSYLTFMGRRGREILLVGAMFTLGVFVSYLAAGLGLSRLLQPLAGVQAALKLWVFGFTALLCLGLAAVSVHDYIKARQGKTGEMKLKMSLDVRKQVNRVIREGSKMRAFYLVAFVVGAVVSLIQLTCTSPIYVGILFLIHDVPQLQSNALIYLLVYNLAYIVPLVAVFLFAYFGTSSEQLGNFITKRTAAIKLLTVVVFLVLAGWLLYSLVGLIGVA